MEGHIKGQIFTILPFIEHINCHCHLLAKRQVARHRSAEQKTR